MWLCIERMNDGACMLLLLASTHNLRIIHYIDSIECPRTPLLIRAHHEDWAGAPADFSSWQSRAFGDPERRPFQEPQAARGGSRRGPLRALARVRARVRVRVCAGVWVGL